MCKPSRCYKDFSKDEVGARDASSWPQYKQSELGRPKTKSRKRKSRMISNLLSAWYYSGRANISIPKFQIQIQHNATVIQFLGPIEIGVKIQKEYKYIVSEGKIQQYSALFGHWSL